MNKEDLPPELLNQLSSDDSDVSLGKVSISDLLLLLQSRIQSDYNTIISSNFIGTGNEIQDIFHFINEGNVVIITGIITLTLIMMGIIHMLMSSSVSTPVKASTEDEDEEIVLRDFTIQQLREFDGVENKKIYIALKGDVYDVTCAKEYYGPESTYHCFAGRDASRAMAKLSFDEEELSNPRIDDLGPFERDVLENWVDKFKFLKNYVVVGRLVYPATDRVFTLSELRQYTGDKTAEDESTGGTSSGRIHQEILMAVKGKVYDVSFGGTDMYGPGCPYHLFAGRDASRALAKMSFNPEDIETRDLSDLTAEQLKVLDDWDDKFANKKKYPVVGRLVGGDSSNAETAAAQAINNKLAKQ
eukprot:CAMPEP_0185020740 /NCGR_PEP_ID=MMETSP1103-20130426/3385_1 /TAXON_ID=36769 /ORGANISM="Paraphysomonas bandaiensis, Strain Caron Lab Isolate" /LENGTH=357 /DNA_ID=CAMNT_0027551827 /DNA_START=13 /DNA_END=1086 /DNA_ORIENTATION=-